jgi:hypothetical protein
MPHVWWDEQQAFGDAAARTFVRLLLMVAAALSVIGLLTLQPVLVLDAGLMVAAGLGMVVLWLLVAVPIMLGFMAIVSASRWLGGILSARRAA